MSDFGSPISKERSRVVLVDRCARGVASLQEGDELRAYVFALEAVVEAAYVAKHEGIYEPLHNALRDLERLP